MWYVFYVEFHMNRVGAMNDEITAFSTKYLLPNDGAQARECRRKTMKGVPKDWPVNVNFYEFNGGCKGVSLVPLYDGLSHHEGFGSTGQNGHESQARIAAARPENDPRLGVEAYVFDNEAFLRSSVSNEVWARDMRISAYGASHDQVHSNWCGDMWVWNETLDAYEFVPIRTALTENPCL
jgi:hypothetical protein